MVERTFPQVRLIRNAANVGFARANNQALRLSRGRYALLLNPDTVILDQSLVQMVHVMDQHPDIGALGPKVLTAQRAIDLRCARRFPGLLSELFELTRLSARFPQNRLFGHYLMSYWGHDDDRDVDALSGACLMVRRDAFEEVGMMDEDFFMYAEDIDWCYRFKKAGWRVFYYSAAAILHLGNQSSQLARTEMGIERFRSRQRFFEKHCGSSYATLYRGVLLLITLFKQLIFLAGFVRHRGSQRDGYREKIGLHGQVLRWVLTGTTSSVEDKGGLAWNAP
jgi:hypothetical protein